MQPKVDADQIWNGFLMATKGPIYGKNKSDSI